MAPTIQQKVERLKEELGLDAALSIKDAIQEANNIVGLQAVGSLGDQLDKLIAELGINLTPEESTPNARAAGAGLDAARKRNKGPMVPSAPNHASSGRPQSAGQPESRSMAAQATHLYNTPAQSVPLWELSVVQKHKGYVRCGSCVWSRSMRKCTRCGSCGWPRNTRNCIC